MDPRLCDEPTVALKLYGRNEAECVEVNGWTNDFPINFPGTPAKLKIRGDINDLGAIPEDSTPEERRNRERILARQPVSLLHLYNSTWPNTSHSIFSPVSVIVLAKKKIEFVVKNESCLLFGSILVADKDGNYCVLDIMNDTITCLYDEVSPGDCLLIAGGTFSQNNRFYGNSPFRPEMHVKLTVKLTSYHCRNVYRILGNTSSFEFPNALTEDRRLWTPSELFTDNTCNIRPLKEDQLEFVDIIGVVSHVGRMERFQKYNCAVIPVGPDQTELDKISLAQYNAFRWIEIVDQASAFPLPIRIFMNKCNWDLQKSLVPGALIVISFAEKNETIFSYDHLSTSRFSSIYINEEITSYVKLMPQRFRDTVYEVLGIPSVTRIFENKEIQWTAGGSYPLPFKSEAQFSNFYAERRNGAPEKQLLNAPVLPMERRQVEYIFFRGEIIQHRPVLPGVPPQWTWSNTEIVKQYSSRRSRKIAPILPDKIEDLWYVFTRKIPQPKYIPPKKPNDTRKIFQDISEANSKYCGPLLMPAMEATWLKELPVVDGMPHFVLDIVNFEAQDEALNQYKAIWKPSRHLNIEQMQSKLENSKGKPILIMMEVHRVESMNMSQSAGFELILQDFSTIILEDPAPEVLVSQPMLESQCESHE